MIHIESYLRLPVVNSVARVTVSCLFALIHSSFISKLMIAILVPTENEFWAVDFFSK